MFEYLGLLSFGEGGWSSALLAGALVTIALALTCIPVGLPLGLLVALGRRVDNKFINVMSVGFSTVFRGLPELLTLFIIYFGCQILAQKLMSQLGYEGEVSINAFVAAVIAFSLVFAAFSSEIWFAAFKSVGKGQYEAAQVLGLSKRNTFLSVILPQLIRVALPGLSNNWLSLLKDTSLVATISLVDIMRQTTLAVTATKQAVLFYLVACIMYLVISAVAGRIFAMLEARYALRN